MLKYHETSLEECETVLEFFLSRFPEQTRRERISNLKQTFIARSETKVGEVFPGLFHWTREGKIIGVLYTILRPDKTLLTLLPVVAPGESQQTLEIIYDKLINFAESNCSPVIMLLADSIQEIDEVCRSRGGFRKMSGLSYLVCESPLFPKTSPVKRLHFVPYTQTVLKFRSSIRQAPQREAFGEGRRLPPIPATEYQERDWKKMVSLVEQTYQNTRDFPELSGICSTESVLKGYMEDHPFNANLWFFIEFQERPIGTLIMTELEKSQVLELTYMGLIPDFRGKALSHEIVAFAKFTAGTFGAERLLVSVDTRNEPAAKVYERHDFQVYDHKEIYARFF